MVWITNLSDYKRVKAVSIHSRRPSIDEVNLCCRGSVDVSGDIDRRVDTAYAVRLQFERVLSLSFSNFHRFRFSGGIARLHFQCAADLRRHRCSLKCLTFENARGRFGHRVFENTLRSIPTNLKSLAIDIKTRKIYPVRSEINLDISLINFQLHFENVTSSQPFTFFFYEGRTRELFFLLQRLEISDL
jgi:hypothetical protein